MENNQTKEKLLAEIERLKKELKKKKKYGLVWEDKPEDVVEMCKEKLPVLKEVKNKEIITDKNKPVNLLIEGDNYHSLSVLNYTHKGKIDVIYIDPPYNTGNKDFKYNDRFVDKEDGFRHSKWLNFMEKRLKLAKSLLKNDGVIFISIDDNEQAHLQLLCDDIFGEENKVNQFVWISNLKGRQISNSGAAQTYEYVLCYAKNLLNIEEFIAEFSWLKDKMPSSYKGFKYETKKDKIAEYYITNELHNTNSKFNEQTRPNLVFDIYYNPKTYEIITENVSSKHLHKNFVKISPKQNNDGVHKYHAYRWSRNKIANEPHDLEFIKSGDTYKIYTKRRNFTTIVKDLITDINTTQGSSDIKDILPRGSFDYPKPINLIQFLLQIIQKSNAIVLDFFAGSGTTGHAVLELNKKDGGNRKFILCTNNENNIATDVSYPRIKKVIEGYKNLKRENIVGLGGNLKYFKTDFVDYKESTDRNKIKLTKEAVEMLCVKEGTFESVLDNEAFKIFKNHDHYAGIIFDQLAIEDFKKAVKGIKGKTSVYIFSLGDDSFEDEFEDIKQKVKLSPIPEAILKVYRRIYK